VTLPASPTNVSNDTSITKFSALYWNEKLDSNSIFTIHFAPFTSEANVFATWHTSCALCTRQPERWSLQITTFKIGICRVVAKMGRYWCPLPRCRGADRLRLSKKVTRTVKFL
jgi:hypothetical protein